MKLCVTCIFMALFTLMDVGNSTLLIRNKCPTPILMNGRVRVMSRGRTARFRCNQTFQLLGEKYATCLRGVWDMIPICVKPGCFPLPSLRNGQILESYKGAVVRLLCNPGYSLFGSSFMYCNGAVWNDTISECRASEKMVQTWCDFESPDLCGWTQDPHHNFDWSRRNFQTPSGNVGTGPSFDHTLGPGRGGYYMFIESSSPRMENDTARLYSPIYASQLTASQPSCFIFWYHMYGFTTGSLHVYIKPENAEFGDSMLPRFTKSRDQGDQWYQAIVLLPSINESFQVIIEAVRGAGYVSDIAIDDVKVANGSDCLSPEAQTPSPTELVDQSGGGNDIYESTQSCRLRCTRPRIKASTFETLTLAECECHAGCLQTATCCPDYASYCMLPTELDTKVTKSTSRPYPSPPPLPPLPPFPSPDLPTAPANTQTSLSFEITSELPKPLGKTEVPDVPYKPIQPTMAQDGLEEWTSSITEFNKRIPIPTDPTPLILQPPTGILIPKKPSFIPKGDRTSVWFSTVNPVNSTITPHSTLFPSVVSKRPSPAVTELNRAVVTESLNTLNNKTWSTSSTTLKVPTVSIPIKSSLIPTTFLVSERSSAPVKPTLVTQIYPKATQSTRKLVNLSTITITKLKRTTETSIPTVSLPIGRGSDIPRETPEVTEQLHYSVSSTAVPWMKVTRGQKWILARRGPIPEQKKDLSQSAVVGILVTVILIVTVVAVTIYFVVRNRRRIRKQQCMADDSDVRFLTSDEILDFSLARPIDGSTDSL